MVFLDLQEADVNLYWGRLLQTFEGYGAGTKMRGIMADLWVPQGVVTQQNGYHGPQFRATRGTNQWGMISPKLINVAVDSVIWHWLYMAVEDDAVIYDGLGHVVGQRLGVFYVDDGLLW